jgi:hypothetical protein
MRARFDHLDSAAFMTDLADTTSPTLRRWRSQEEKRSRTDFDTKIDSGVQIELA